MEKVGKKMKQMVNNWEEKFKNIDERVKKMEYELKEVEKRRENDEVI